MKNYNIQKLCLGSIVLLLSLFSLTAQAYQGEVFACTYKGNSNMDDLLKARDNYVKQAKKAGITLPPAFLWSNIKGGSDADVLWFNYYQNAAQYGAITDAIQASSSMTAAVQKFYNVSDCQSFLLKQEEIFTGGEAYTGQTTYIDSYACNYRDGAGPSSLRDLKAHTNAYLKAAGNYKSFRFFQQNAMTPSKNSPDVRFYGVHNNAADWGMRDDSLTTSEDGQALNRHWQAILDCTAAHWSGQQVVETPPAS